MLTNIPKQHITTKSIFKDILRLWKEFLPLSITDMAMAIGDPVRNYVIASLPKPQLTMASFGVSKSLANFFEAPVIMILHASNALAYNKKSSKVFLRFSLCFSFVFSILFLFFAIPWVFEFVSENIFKLSPEISQMTQMFNLALFLFPFVIGWRRFFQGLLINQKKNMIVAHASLVRLFFVVTLPLLGMKLGQSGFVCAVASIMGGLIAESLYVTYHAAKRELLSNLGSHEKLPDTFLGILKYYLPLANTMIVIWGVRALLVFLLSYSVEPVKSLTIWPIVWGFVLVLSNGTRMVQQVYISQVESSKESMNYFIFSVGVVFSILLVMILYHPVGREVIRFSIANLSQLEAEIYSSLSYFILFPFLTTWQNAFQGVLIKEHKTKSISKAAFYSHLLIIVLAISFIFQEINGVKAIALSLNIGLIFELFLLRVYDKNFTQV